jgi:hypothetical protein
VYAWFGRWLLGITDETELKEKPYNVEMPSRVLVFFGRERPAGITPDGLASYLIDQAKSQSRSPGRRDEPSLREFDDTLGSAFRHSVLAVEPEPAEVALSKVGGTGDPDSEAEYLILSRRGAGDKVPAVMWLPTAHGDRGRRIETARGRRGVGSGSASPKAAILIIHPEGKEALVKGTPVARNMLISALLGRGAGVMSIDCFQTGSEASKQSRTERYFTTYNRTADVNRVQDILTAVAYLKGRTGSGRVGLIGLGKAGLWCLLAAGLAKRLERLAADFDLFDIDSDQEYLKKLFIPGLRRAGDFRTAVALASPTPLLIHNLGEAFAPGVLRSAYQAADGGGQLTIQRERLSDLEIANWFST